jgi:hypothetical protein
MQVNNIIISYHKINLTSKYKLFKINRWLSNSKKRGMVFSVLILLILNHHKVYFQVNKEEKEKKGFLILNKLIALEAPSKIILLNKVMKV